MIYDIAPKPTRYDGVLYRSRTEARWAMFFTLAKIPFVYEPETFELPSGNYLPDFWMPEADYGRGMFIEIKPSMIEAGSREAKLAYELHVASKRCLGVVWGSPKPDHCGAEHAFFFDYSDDLASNIFQFGTLVHARRERHAVASFMLGDGNYLPLGGPSEQVGTDAVEAARMARDYRFGA